MVIGPLFYRVFPDRYLGAIVEIPAGGQDGEREDDGAGQGAGGEAPRQRTFAEEPPAQQVSARHCAGDHRRQRKVHAMFGHDLRGDRKKAGARSEDEEEPRPQKAPPRAIAKRSRRRAQQDCEGEPGGGEVNEAPGDRPAVIEHQRVREERELQIVEDDDVALSPGVVQCSYVEPEPDRLAAGRGRHQRCGQPPRRGEREVETPAPPYRLAERAGNERAIVEQHQQRSGRRDLLRAHSQYT